MKSARPSDIEPDVSKMMGPHRARLAGQAEKAAEVAPPIVEPVVVPEEPATEADIPPVDSEGWQIVGSRHAKKGAPIPQTAPVEGSLIKLEVSKANGSRPNAGGASSSSRAACHLEKAMPAVDQQSVRSLSLIHISEPTRLRRISYAVFCLKKKKKKKTQKQQQTNNTTHNTKKV